MLFEFLAIQITIYLHSHRKNNDKIKVKYINIKENIRQIFNYWVKCLYYNSVLFYATICRKF